MTVHRASLLTSPSRATRPSTARPSAPCRSRALARTAAALAVVAALAAGCTSASEGDAPADVVDQGYQSGDGSATTWVAADRKGPVELSGTAYDGSAQDVADWRGDVVVLNTWYANCPPCRAEAPDLVALATDYADDGVHVLGINGTDAAGAAEAFQRQFDVPYVSIEDTDGSAIAALQGVVPVNAVPTTILLDRDGKVAARILGLAEASTLRALVDELLAEQPGGAAS
ncbi:TlpA family protein disulfide reductase [Cellulomonas algicola]|uniref:TlpA family protein disulfide reductase n=2 Tax=Cellulomonas algicola TaxID=2071633 RepID=UPI001C3FB530|nr:TlpA disulfide reductase family protein [Cellulomonas algicola]